MPCGAFNFNFIRRILPPPQNYLSLPRGKSFFTQILFHSLYKVSLGFGGTVFLSDVGGTCLNRGTKKISGRENLQWMMPRPMALFWCLFYLWTYFTLCSSVSVANFEHVNAGWFLVELCLMPYIWGRVPLILLVSSIL